MKKNSKKFLSMILISSLALSSNFAHAGDTTKKVVYTLGAAVLAIGSVVLAIKNLLSDMRTDDLFESINEGDLEKAKKALAGGVLLIDTLTTALAHKQYAIAQELIKRNASVSDYKNRFLIDLLKSDQVQEDTKLEIARYLVKHAINGMTLNFAEVLYHEPAQEQPLDESQDESQGETKDENSIEQRMYQKFANTDSWYRLEKNMFFRFLQTGDHQDNSLLKVLAAAKQIDKKLYQGLLNTTYTHTVLNNKQQLPTGITAHIASYLDSESVKEITNKI